MGNFGRQLLSFGLAILITGGMLYAGSAFLDRQHSQEWSNGGRFDRETFEHLSLGLSKAGGDHGLRKTQHAPESQTRIGDSRDETERFLASRRIQARNAPVKKWLPDLPFRASSRDPIGLQDPTQAIAPDWLKYDWVTRYPSEK